MTTLRRLDALAASCYDAALGHVSWASVLGDIASTFDSTHATLLQQRWLEREARVPAQHGFAASTIAAYEEYFKDRNVVLQELHKVSNLHLSREGVVRTNVMFCPDAVLLSSEYYNDFLRPISVRHLLSTTLSERDAVQITVFQEKASTSRHLRAMRYLAPHLRRALQVHDRLKEAYAYRSAFEDYLEGIARGAALLDACGAVIYANAALRTIVAARDGVVSASSMLSANDAVAARRLRKAVASAASGGPGGRFAIPRPSGAAPYHLLVSPLGSADAIAPNRRGVLVIISDPTRTESFDVPLLSEIYGFTPAECQIACQLANGHSAEGIADAMGIAVGTVRTHLKRVLHKTQTHRQTDLVRLLLLGRTLP